MSKIEFMFVEIEKLIKLWNKHEIKKQDVVSKTELHHSPKPRLHLWNLRIKITKEMQLQSCRSAKVKKSERALELELICR